MYLLLLLLLLLLLMLFIWTYCSFAQLYAYVIHASTSAKN